jgi:phosphatidylglycerol:prolipoprotein diacylglycerol transferase
MILNSFLDFGSKYFLEIGNLKIAWYAICILTGIILACVLGVREAKKFGISSNIILDGVLICVPLAIVGARLYYVFTSWDKFYISGDFVGTLLKIIGYSESEGFKLEGLAINGGIIVAILFVIIYCKVRKVNVFQIFDLLAPGLLIGQICGRWGNFFNQEAHGPAITASTEWITNFIPSFIMDKMYFYDGSLGETALWHPTFLYESTWNLIALILILVSRRKNKHQRIGDTIAFYLIWYGLGRAIIIEPLRMDPLLFVPSLGMDLLFNRVNVVINLVLAVIGIIWILLKHLKFKEPYYIEVQKEIKENKIDGVICRLDETMVTVKKLLENCYYYTAKEVLDIDLTDEEIEKLIDKKPDEYFESEEALTYFNEYFNSHLNQMQTVLDCKAFFKTLYKHDYNVAVVTKYSKEVAEYILDVLKITTYISIIIDKDLGDMNTALNSINGSKNVLVITAKAADIEFANNYGLTSCLIYFGPEIDLAMEMGPTHVINKTSQLDSIIIE